MSKAIIFIPNKNPMQSGTAKNNKWILEFITNDPTKNPLMGWESSSDTLTELKLEFSSKELAISYAKKKKIDFELIEPKTIIFENKVSTEKLILAIEKIKTQKVKMIIIAPKKPNSSEIKVKIKSVCFSGK